jgi:poly(hydroxyalkanoate) depolymerase family esterase
MAKSLSSLWLKSVRRMGKTQQSQSRKLFKSLLAKSVKAARAPVTPARRTTPKAAAAKLARTTTAKKPGSAVKKVASKQVILPGSWKKSYFSLPAAGMTPARRMQYSLYVPAGKAVAPRPLVVMLHGCQQTVADFATSTRMNELAERKGFAVLYPQQSATSDRHRCWHWYKRPTQQGQGDVSLIAAMVAQVQARHGFDASRTYVAGLSAGAGLAALLALHHPELIAAAGLHSAPVFGTTDSAMTGFRAMQQGSASHGAAANALLAADPRLAMKSGLPVMLIHGDRDSVVRRINLRQLEQQFLIINAGAVTREQPVRKLYPGRATGRSPRHAYQTVSYYAGRQPQVVCCEISGLGHAWSGGDSSVPFSAREGPNASLMLWSFFSRHRRLVLAAGSRLAKG